MKTEKQKLHNALLDYLRCTLDTSSEDWKVYSKALELFRIVEQLDESEKTKNESTWIPQPGESILVRDYFNEGWIVRKFVKMNPNGIGVMCEGRIFGYEISFLQYKRLEL